MTTAINDAIEAAYDALAGIEVEVSNAETAILKAIKGNGRFKDSSVWVLLPSGKYKHVQSGKVTRASRLAGYTQAFSL